MPPQPQPTSLGRGISIAFGLVLLVLSAGVAVCAGLVSRSAWRPGLVTIPWGLVLGAAGSVSLVVIARSLLGRGYGFFAGAGWVGGIAATLVWHPGGDYLFANDSLGVSFLLVATGAVLVAAGWGA